MGEIIVSLVIGGCLVLSGMILIITLNQEEKRWKQEEAEKGLGEEP